MAKKAIATLKKEEGNKRYTKCIKMTKSDKTGAYIYKEEIISNDMVSEFFKK